MNKQIHQFSLQDTMSEKILEQTNTLSTHVDEKLVNQIKTFLITKDNLLGFDSN